jgi:hypothetical protein
MSERAWIQSPIPPRSGPTACDGVEHGLCAECERRRLARTVPETPVWVKPAINPVAGTCVDHVHISVRAIAATSAG